MKRLKLSKRRDVDDPGRAQLQGGQLGQRSEPSSTAILSAGSSNVGITFQVVDAALTSPNPKSFQILGGGTSNVAYQFSTNGTLVTIGTGQLSLSIGVTENAGMSTGSPCSLLTGTGCVSPALCYFVQQPDGSSGGQCLPPGVVPIGATCTGSSFN